jgi:hypothetical protein
VASPELAAEVAVMLAVNRWLSGDPTMPKPPAERWKGRNVFWQELYANDVISMPDCWEYPYFCAWDLMFQSVAFAITDPATAKRQNMLLQGERYTSPSAQQPAYEWALSDANPPIGGWAAWRIYSIERGEKGTGDRAYLKKAFKCPSTIKPKRPPSVARITPFQPAKRPSNAPAA